MAVVYLPVIRLSAVKVGNDASSLFSSSEYLLRGKKSNTTAKERYTASMTAMYMLFCFI